MSILLRFILFYGVLFAGFGAASPFMPALFQSYGLAPGELGLVLAAGGVVRLGAGPLGGWVADWSGRPWLVLTGLVAASSVVAASYGPARGFFLLMLVSVLHAAVLSPVTPVADALIIQASDGGRAFSYGWVRGAASAAFILGVLGSGELIGATGLGGVVWLNASLLLLAACVALVLPRIGLNPAKGASLPSGRALLRSRPYLQLMLVAALVSGSHAMHDVFAVIRWQAAGLSARECGVLWALSVAAEVVVFVLVGPALLRRLGPGRALAVSALAGVVRWVAVAQTSAFGVLALVEPLHGFTFALLHLACVQTIARVVPAGLAATAQAIYGSFAVGAVSVVMTVAAGPLYARFGAGAFWGMAGLCALAIPATRGLGSPGRA